MSTASEARNDIMLKKLRGYLRSDEFIKKAGARDPLHDPNHYQTRWFDEAEIIKAEKSTDVLGSLVWRFPVQKQYINVNGTYAGGAQAATHDVCTALTLPLVAKPPDFWVSSGSSRTLNMSYLKSAREGDVLLLTTQIVQLGSRLCMVRGTMTRENDGALISSSEHHLYNGDADAPSL